MPGSDAVTANQVLTKAGAIALSVSQDRAVAAGLSGTPPLQVKVWTRYNPEARSALFMVPGMTAYVMALVAVLLLPGAPALAADGIYLLISVRPTAKERAANIRADRVELWFFAFETCAREKVAGCSKLARIVDMFARRLQIQERLTEQISQEWVRRGRFELAAGGTRNEIGKGCLTQPGRAGEQHMVEHIAPLLRRFQHRPCPCRSTSSMPWRWGRS